MKERYYLIPPSKRNANAASVAFNDWLDGTDGSNSRRMCQTDCYSDGISIRKSVIPMS